MWATPSHNWHQLGRYHKKIKIKNLLEKVTRNRLFKFFDARAKHKIVVELATLAEIVGDEEKHFALAWMNKHKQGCEGKSFSLRGEITRKYLHFAQWMGQKRFHSESRWR